MTDTSRPRRSVAAVTASVSLVPPYLVYPPLVSVIRTVAAPTAWPAITHLPYVYRWAAVDTSATYAGDALASRAMVPQSWDALRPG